MCSVVKTLQHSYLQKIDQNNNKKINWLLCNLRLCSIVKTVLKGEDELRYLGICFPNILTCLTHSERKHISLCKMSFISLSPIGNIVVE